jgi:hypothetical protein
MGAIATYNPGVAELGRKNQPGGYPGINDAGEIVGTFVALRATAAEVAALTLANGQLAHCKDTLETRIGDGVTPGGIWLASKSQFKISNAVTTLASIGADAPGALAFSVSKGRHIVDGYAYISQEFGGRFEFYLRGPVTYLDPVTNSGPNAAMEIAWGPGDNLDCTTQILNINDLPASPAVKYRPPASFDPDSPEISVRFRAFMTFATAGTLKFSAVPQTAVNGNNRSFWLQVRKVAE